MIAGGNWWRANEIVIRHLSPHTKLRYLGVTKPADPFAIVGADRVFRHNKIDALTARLNRAVGRQPPAMRGEAERLLD
jgi:hypothetical protein